MLPKVDIILLNHNGIKFTPSCILSLKKKTVYPHHIIVVDNVSVDGSREWLRQNQKNFPNLTVHFNEKLDSGYANGTNIALEYCKNEYVLLLNNDILIPQLGWLRSLVAELEYDKTIALEGCKLLYPKKPYLIQHAGVSFAYSLEHNVPIPFHIGRYEPREKYCEKRFLPAVTFACALIRREFLKAGLDETYSLGNYEDMDFCCKARKEGWKILYNGEVELFHYEGATQLSRPDQNKWFEHIDRNFSIFLERWQDWLMHDAKKNPELYGAGLNPLVRVNT